MSAAFDPKDKTFKERLDAFLQDAKDTHSLTVRVDNGRTVEWQHMHHIAHMFLYNSYMTTKPLKADKTKRTIAWEHISDPKLQWSTIRWDDFLRTKTKQKPIKLDNAWKIGHEPDKGATEENARAIQKEGKIGNSGKAMVAAGLSPCGEPCRCSAGRSKHLDGVAADLSSDDLAALATKLTAKKAGTLDEYLKKFGLHRPLLNHPTSPEKWHVEAIGG